MPDPGLRTPLLDFFRRGDVARDIRLQAAQGGMAPRAHEQIALLMLLVDDQDPDISSAANATIEMIPQPALEAFLARSDASTEMREFFAARGIAPAAVAAFVFCQVNRPPWLPQGERFGKLLEVVPLGRVAQR